MKILCFDVGMVKPSFVIIEYNKELNIISNIKIYNNIKFKEYKDICHYLDYFFAQEIDLFIIELQHEKKNISLMKFTEGYAVGKNVNVILKSPIAKIRPNKDIKTRSAKKGFSVDIINTFLLKNNIKYKFLKKNCDACDAMNLGLYYLFKKSKEKKTDYVTNFNITINELQSLSLS